MEIYDTIVKAIRTYLQEEDYITLFLNGGCYWFATVVADLVPNSYLMINRTQEHCAVVVEQKLYDITGPISKQGYQYADEKDVCYMKKHYWLHRNLEELNSFIQSEVNIMLLKHRTHVYENLNCNN